MATKFVYFKHSGMVELPGLVGKKVTAINGALVDHIEPTKFQTKLEWLHNHYAYRRCLADYAHYVPLFSDCISTIGMPLDMESHPDDPRINERLEWLRDNAKCDWKFCYIDANKYLLERIDDTDMFVPTLFDCRTVCFFFIEDPKEAMLCRLVWTEMEILGDEDYRRLFGIFKQTALRPATVLCVG